MSGLPLSINGKTTVTATAGGEFVGNNQNPEIVTTVGGGSSNVAAILEALSHNQIPSSSGAANNLIASQSDGSLGNSPISGTLSTPVGSVSASINWQYLLIGFGGVALLLWFVNRK